MIFTDAHIERCAQIYHASAVLPRAVPFIAFLCRPHHHIALYHNHRALPAGDEFLPLLPKQRAVQQRLDAAGRKPS